MNIPATVTTGFPRLYAAASLKLGGRGIHTRLDMRFPRLYAAASLKLEQWREEGPQGAAFSAALCRGLIEAAGTPWRCDA